MSSTEPTHAVFSSDRCLALGSLADALRALKQEPDAAPLLTYDLSTGREVDFDLRPSLDELLKAHAPAPQRGPGRPKLGVTSREISLLPRHWAFLEGDPRGISAALRQLVEEAMKGPGQARRLRDATGNLLTGLAGNRPGYEEASRALYAGDLAGFDAATASWPVDVRDLVRQRARAALG
ncbi:MAG TPA: DUF2239 family protein [Polyangiaceae bacterium]|nr:DUF2239 family protein [Polyangiaceae bacterium]